MIYYKWALKWFIISWIFLQKSDALFHMSEYKPKLAKKKPFFSPFLATDARLKLIGSSFKKFEKRYTLLMINYT